MKLDMLENGKILIEKDNRHFLIEKFRISGTLIDNYGIYEDIYNDLAWFTDDDNDDKYFCRSCASLEEALLQVYKDNCE